MHISSIKQSRGIRRRLRGRAIVLVVAGSLSLNVPIASSEPVTAATVAAGIGLPIVVALVNKVLEQPRKAIAGWILTSIGIQPKPEIEDAINKINALDKKIDSLRSEVQTAFVTLRCENHEILLSGAVKNINLYRADFIDLINPSLPSSWEKKRRWAERVADDFKGIRKDIASISATLLGDDKPGGQKNGLLALCGEKLRLNWTNTGKLANERAYYEPLLTLQSYYYLQQVSALQMLVNAKHLLAAVAAKDEGIIINEQADIEELVCGDFYSSLQQSPPMELNDRQQLCMDGLREPVRFHAELIRQLSLVGAGYSYDVNNPEQSQWVSAINPHRFDGRGQLWVLNPKAYPNAGKTAYEARSLENKAFAGISDWRGAGTADWNALLDKLDWAQGDGYVDRNLDNQVGFVPYSYSAGAGNKAAQGKGAVIWMNEETSAYWAGISTEDGKPEIFEAYCLLIPYSKRDKRHMGRGRPICSEIDMMHFLLPFQRWASTYSEWMLYSSSKWLSEATGSQNFSFIGMFTDGSKVYPGPAGNYDNEIKGKWFRNGSWETTPPGWIKNAKGPSLSPQSNVAMPIMTRTRVELNERPEQVIVPIKDVGSNKLAGCTKGRPWANINGIPSMCGDNLDKWLAMFVPPLSKELTAFANQLQ